MFLLFLFIISIHNTEEGIWLMRMTRHSKVRLYQAVKQDQFLFAVIAVTAAAYFVTSMFILFPENVCFKYAYFGFLAAMMLNVLFSYLLGAIIERKYSPGLMTGILLIIPVHTIIIMRAFQSHLILFNGLIIGTFAMSTAMLFLIPLMFKLASKWICFSQN
nr:HXXEE domain-containing protein [Sporolactobacillus mangiferae]